MQSSNKETLKVLHLPLTLNISDGYILIVDLQTYLKHWVLGKTVNHRIQKTRSLIIETLKERSYSIVQI